MISHLTSLFLFATSSSPAVDRARQELVNNSDRWFSWLVVSSIVVGIGVCLEFPEATIALKRWYLHWKAIEDIPPENERRLTVPVEYLGLLLVILGVIGEGLFESLSSSAETALRAHDEQTLAESIRTAGDAQKSAEDAAGAAKTAQDLAQGVFTIAADAKTKAEVANTAAGNALGNANVAKSEVAKMGKSVAAVKQDIGQVQTYAASVEQKYAPRSLSKEERDGLIAALKGCPSRPDGLVAVQSFIGTQDGASFALELANAISDPLTGWSARVTGQNASAGEQKGVFVAISDLRSAPSWINCLLDGLKAAGLGKHVATDPLGLVTTSANPVVVFVAPKN